MTASLDAAAQQPEVALPPGATPGGAQPYFGREPAQLMAQRYELEIPPLIERPLGIEEGPRVRVIEFDLVGMQDRPENEIRLEEITTILNRHLATQPIEGYTINQLQAIADDITLYYRNRGLILAQAFVPSQDVRDGVVRLQMLEGLLGGISVEGNELYDADRIIGPFNDLLANAVDQNEIEEALLTLQDFPGLTVFGTFRQGGGLGDTELVVSVREEDRFYITPSVDNYGSEFTGDTRAMIQFGINNPGGGNSRLQGYYLSTASPSNGSYYGLEYGITTLNGKNTVGFGGGKNRFDVVTAGSAANLDIEGTVRQGNLFVEHNFAKRRRFRADGTFDIARKNALIRQSGDDPRDELTVLSYGFDFYAVGPRQRGINLGYIRAAAGENGSDNPSRVAQGGVFDDSFAKLELGFQRLQRVSDHHSLLLRLDGQKSDDLLVSLEQYSIGGPANVRAYPVAQALIDTGGSATLEWIIDAPGFADRPVGSRTWGDIFQLSFFYDYAGGELNDPLQNELGKVNLRGYGMALQFSVSQKFYLRLDAATPDSSMVPGNGKDPQYYMSFNYTF